MDFTNRRVLQLLHTYAPFLTEELWQGLGFGPESVMLTPWPTDSGFSEEPKARAIFDAASKARNLRATYNIPSNKRLPWRIEPVAEWVREEFPVLSILLHSESLEAVSSPPVGAAACPSDIGTIYLPLADVVDSSTERKRLDVEIGKVEAEIEKVARKLSSESFVNNAPQDVVEDHRQRQQDWIARLAELQRARAALG
jgi:valyl-tRNA synthetase